MEGFSNRFLPATPSQISVMGTGSGRATSAASYMPQLDGLRAIAFIAVAVSHWAPDFLTRMVPWGTGVQLFFVLSGFLITGILLRSRPAELGIPLRHVLKVFYARRILRIFPLYYGVIALALIFSLGPIATTWPWHVAYVSNIHYAFSGHADMFKDPFLHLWSLSVEEQFYLIWPFVVLVTNRRTLPFILVGTIVGSGIFRVGIDQLVPQIVSVRYLTPSCLDALAIGGLVAYVAHERGPAGVRRLSIICGWVSIIGLAVCVIPLARVIDRDVAHRFGHTFLVLFYGVLVARASQGFEWYPGKLLGLRPLRYLGKISYGLYVYHYFAPLLVHRFARFFGYESLLHEKAIAISAYAVFTLAAAAVSWHLYEHPINNLKRYFAYPRPTRLAVAPTTAVAYP